MKLEDIEPQKEETGEVEIYSRLAVRGFSIFFSTIFGGVLLMQNLREVGLKKAANIVLLFSIAYTVTGMVIVSYIKPSGSGLPFLYNIVGAVILADYFFPKYFPEKDYYPKKIWKPLLVSLIIAFSLLVLMYYGGAIKPVK